MVTGIGVKLTTSLRSGPTNTGVESGTLHIAGLTERGPAGSARRVHSLADYEGVYGGRTAYSGPMYDTARLFFEEGGADLLVSRAVGAAAEHGSIVLMDQAPVVLDETTQEPVSGPLETLLVEASEPGAYSTGLTVAVTPGGGGETFTITVANGTGTLATFPGLTSPADAVAAAAGNPHVRITSLGSATPAPGNNPAALEATALTAGTDDRAAVTVDTVVSALESAGIEGRGGAVAAPGYDAQTIGAQLATYGKANMKQALLDLGPEATVAEAISAGTQLADMENGDSAGLFYPWLTVADGTRTRTVSPVGYVAAARARAHATNGYWQVPAGDRAAVRWVVGTTTPVDTITNNALAAARVNGIVTTRSGTRLYGWQSLAADQENLGLLSARDTLNNLGLQIEAALEPYVFGTIDGRRHLLGQIESAVTGVLDPIAQRGGLFALVVGDETRDPGYRVQVSATGNEVAVAVSVRLSGTAQLISVEIIKVALTAAV